MCNIVFDNHIPAPKSVTPGQHIQPCVDVLTRLTFTEIITEVTIKKNQLGIKGNKLFSTVVSISITKKDFSTCL